MPRDDPATSGAEQQILDAIANPPEGWVGYGPVRLGGHVVAGPPDDAAHMARLEILAALNGEPTPGAMW